MNRVGIFIKSIHIDDVLGARSYSYLNGKSTDLIPNRIKGDRYDYNISAKHLQPGQQIKVPAANEVKVITVQQDGDNFYDLGTIISSDRIYSIEVRSFIKANLTNINKNQSEEYIVFADLVF